MDLGWTSAVAAVGSALAALFAALAAHRAAGAASETLRHAKAVTHRELRHRVIETAQRVLIEHGLVVETLAKLRQACGEHAALTGNPFGSWISDKENELAAAAGQLEPKQQQASDLLSDQAALSAKTEEQLLEISSHLFLDLTALVTATALHRDHLADIHFKNQSFRSRHHQS